MRYSQLKARIQPGTLLIFAWTGLCTFAPIGNNDIWIHLRVAEDFLAHHTLPELDTYSALAAGHRYVAHEWLSGLLFLAVERIPGGPPGAWLSVLQSVLAVTGLAWLYQALDSGFRRSALAVPVLFAAGSVINIRANLRPHLISWAIEAGLILVIERWRARGGRFLLAVVPIMFGWANLHGGALLGAAVMVILSAGVAFCVRFPRFAVGEPRPYSATDSRLAAVAAAGAVIACFATPYGWRVPALALGLNSSPLVQSKVLEWRSPFVGHLTPWAVAYFTLVLWSWSMLWLQRRAPRPVDWIFAILGTVMSFRSMRFMPEALVLLLPGAARAWSGWLVAGRREVPRSRWAESAVGVVLIASALRFGFAYSAEHARSMGWGWASGLPMSEVAFLKRGAWSGPIFNDFADGALIIHELEPKIRPVIDSRSDVYGDDLFREYLDAAASPDGFDSFVARHGVRLAMLSPEGDAPTVVEYLAHNPDWTLLLRTKSRVLYAHR